MRRFRCSLVCAAERVNASLPVSPLNLTSYQGQTMRNRTSLLTPLLFAVFACESDQITSPSVTSEAVLRPAGTFVTAEHRVQKLAGGAGFECGLKSDGSVVCWGIRAATTGIVPMSPPAGLPLVTEISAGQEFVCALTADATVSCWGNYFGFGTWRPMSAPPDLASVRQVRASLQHACALKADQSVVCWGDNSYGQLAVPGACTSTSKS